MSGGMTLEVYLEGLRGATTLDELQAAERQPYQHRCYHGRNWERYLQVRQEAGERICAAHPLGCYVPRFDRRGRRLALCGESYHVGSGQNAAGQRYVWHYAGEWAKGVLSARGFSRRAAHRLWDSWEISYPDRTLAIAADALAGRLPDPDLHVLIRQKPMSHGEPIRYSAEQNKRSSNRRASRRCPSCGGTLWDWGAGFSEGWTYVQWLCCGCPDAFTEYMTFADLTLLRREVVLR